MTPYGIHGFPLRVFVWTRFAVPTESEPAASFPQGRGTESMRLDRTPIPTAAGVEPRRMAAE